MSASSRPRPPCARGFSAFAAGTAATPKDAEVLPELSLEEGGSGLDSLRRQYSKPLYVLMTMVGLILAIACANLANLLLARAAARRREIAVRLSLGASRGRIVRQMLTESVLLSVAGGALGLGVALAGIRFITWLLANGQEQFTLRAALDWPVLGFTFALAVAAGVLFGLAPAIQATKVDFTPALKENRLQGSGAHGRRFRPRLGQSLIVLQIAVSLLLVIGAGLFVRTLANLHAIDVGFNRENLLLVSLNGRQGGYRDAALARFYAGLLDRFREIPGVRAASASNFPLVAHYVNDADVHRPRPDAAAGRSSTDLLNVDPAFLETMQIPVLLGRSLEPADLASPNVAVVNQKFASTFFGGGNPVGRQFCARQPRRTRCSRSWESPRRRTTIRCRKRYRPSSIFPTRRISTGLGQLFFELRTAGPPLERRRGRPPHRARGQSERLHQRNHHPGAAHRPDHLAAAHLRRSRHLLRGAGPADRLRGAVRRHGVHGGAAHRRDRHPHGAGRAAAGHHLDGAARGAGPGRRRAAVWAMARRASPRASSIRFSTA